MGSDRVPGLGADYRSLVEEAPELIVAVRPDATVGFVNEAVTRELGYDPHEVVGRSIVDFLHPEQLDRAVLALGGWQRWGSPQGTTSFHLCHADGTWKEYDIAARGMALDGDDQFVVFCRPADYQHAIEAVLAHLLAGASRAESLVPVLDVFSWRPNDSQVAITWHEEGIGHRFVSTGIPAELAGVDGAASTPWGRVRRSAEALVDDEQATLDASRRALASAHGRGGLWIVPVLDAASSVPALITVWGRHDGGPPTGHAYGMQVAELYVELILQWCDQVDRLRAAASSDPLTGLANRRSFFEALESERGGGALLFCDLDGFKPINDRHGHAAGDAVLRAIAERLTACVRAGDLVARTGGDEFVVLARGATPDQAAALASRLSATARQPVHVPDGPTVRVGLSVGLAHAADRLTETTLAEADRDLLAAKARRRRPGEPG